MISFNNRRTSHYKSYPGNITIMTKFASFIKSRLFVYSNQMRRTYGTINHPVGGAQLFMAWATSADENPPYVGGGDPYPYQVQGTVHSLPHKRYYSYDTSSDPKNPVYVTYPYDNYTIKMNRTSYYVQYNALAGPVGMTYYDYIRITIFNDTFNAPFIKPGVL